MGTKSFSPRLPAERNGAGDGPEGESRPGHQPDEAEAPEEPQRDGVVVARNAEVEVAQKLLVDEVEPGPAVDVALRRQWHREGTMRVSEACGMALRGVRQRDEDVPGRGDGEEDGERRERMELADAGDCGARAARQQQVDQDNSDWEDDADQALGEDAEGAADGEGVTEPPEILWRFEREPQALRLGVCDAFAQDDRFSDGLE